MNEEIGSIETQVDHLQFYMEHNISPVRQDIVDLTKHFDRRGSLYRYLGMPAISFRDRDVLEIGPGSGHNSLYVSSCLPKSYDLLEPNPAGQEGIARLYADFNLEHTEPTLIKKRLEDFSPDRLYDVVISECWLGVSRHEREMMVKLGTFVKPGGVLIFTLESPAGSAVNAFRRLLADKLTWDEVSMEEKTRILVKAFSTHLDTMKDMTRPYEDWVQDCMINPGFMTICPTPAMFMEGLGGEFSMYNSYPRFVSDWRWYKSLYGENKRFNERYMDAYYRNSHNFFDYTTNHPERDPEKNKDLDGYCYNLLSLIVDMEEKRDSGLGARIAEVVRLIQSNIGGLSDAWDKGIEEFLNLYARERITVEDIAGMEHLRPIFGRELIYITAIKDVSLR